MNPVKGVCAETHQHAFSSLIKFMGHHVRQAIAPPDAGGWGAGLEGEGALPSSRLPEPTNGTKLGCCGGCSSAAAADVEGPSSAEQHYQLLKKPVPDFHIRCPLLLSREMAASWQKWSVPASPGLLHGGSTFEYMG